MRFGFLTLPNVPWAELERRWRALDELGAETIWVADHLGNPYKDEPWFEGWTSLSGMAAVTERARIGPLVSSQTLRNPAVLARAAITLDHASGGRAELGVGAGGSAFDHQLTEVENWDAGERARRFAAFVARLVEVLGDDVLQPRSVQERIPLTVGGHARGTLRLAGRHADRWNSYGGHGLSAEEGRNLTRERNEALDRFCVEIGRDPHAIVRSILIGHSFIAETPWRSEGAFHEFVDAWRAIGMDEIVLYYPPEFAMPEGSVEPGLFERLLTEVVPELSAA